MTAERPREVERVLGNEATARRVAAGFGLLGTAHAALCSAVFLFWDFHVGVPGYAAATTTASGIDVLAGDFSGFALSLFLLGAVGAATSAATAYAVLTERRGLLGRLVVALGAFAVWRLSAGGAFGLLLSAVVVPVGLSRLCYGYAAARSAGSAGRTVGESSETR